MKRLSLFAAAVLAATSAALAAAPAFDEQPPGQVVQNVTAYLSGEAMHSAWRVVASRVLAGKQMGETPVYQWHLSFYAPAPSGLKLVYHLPNGSGDLLAKVVQAHGAQMYYPMQTLRIAGTAELERSGVQDVVVQVHQSAADCGSSSVAVFGANAGMSVAPRAVVNNPCDLSAKIVKNGTAQSVQLSGPYYAKNAPLCCPTKPHVTAMLSYSNGKWSVKPAYFSVSPQPPARP